MVDDNHLTLNIKCNILFALEKLTLCGTSCGQKKDIHFITVGLTNVHNKYVDVRTKQ